VALTVKQVAALAYDAGWRGNDVVIATAVAGAESSYDPNAEGPRLCSKGGARGLWQINVCVHTCPNVTDPKANAACAYRIYRSQGWRAWEAHSNGSWKRFQADAARAYAELQGESRAQGAGMGAIVKAALAGLGATTGPAGDAASLAGNVVDTATAVADLTRTLAEFANRLGAWIADPDNWGRVAKVLAGGALIVAGVGIIAKPAVSALPAGKAVKLARKAAA
jgi:hypothetical protein